jgi:hypothetical protein
VPLPNFLLRDLQVAQDGERMTAHLEAMAERNARIGLIDRPQTQIAVEPYDGTEGMVTCMSCARGSGCRDWASSTARLMQRCDRYKPRRSTP